MKLLGRIAAGAVALVLALGAASAAGAADRAIIILDGSGSMWAQIDGEARISVARDTLDKVLDEVPADMELGFMTYGHREKGNCDDIEVMVAPAAGTADAIREAAGTITPLGKTPISDAVRLAAEDLKFTEDKATVILITDGIESCEADPCALASDLESRGVDFTTHVIGFGLNDEEGAQVACLAENTGGKYLQATDADQLADALASTVTEAAAPAEAEAPPAPEAVEYNFDPEMLAAEGGDPLTASEANATWEIYAAKADGSAGERVTTEYGPEYEGSFPAGDYVVRAILGYATIDMPVTLTDTETARPVFVMNAGRMTIRPLPSEGADVDTGAAVFTAFPNGDSTTNYGETTLWAPAGDTEVEVTIGNGSATDTITLAAGGEVTRDIVVGVGHVTVNAFYVEGMRVEDGLAVQIVGAKQDIQGNREDFGTSYGADTKFDLPPGDYVAITKMGAAVAETPFTVESGAAVNVEATLDAGVLAISAPGGDFVEVFEARKDIQGNRNRLDYGYGGELQSTLTAGDYVVSVEMKDGSGSKEAAVTIVAGERNELTVE